MWLLTCTAWWPQDWPVDMSMGPAWIKNTLRRTTQSQGTHATGGSLPPLCLALIECSLRTRSWCSARIVYSNSGDYLVTSFRYSLQLCYTGLPHGVYTAAPSSRSPPCGNCSVFHRLPISTTGNLLICWSHTNAQYIYIYRERERERNSILIKLRNACQDLKYFVWDILCEMSFRLQP